MHEVQFEIVKRIAVILFSNLCVVYEPFGGLLDGDNNVPQQSITNRAIVVQMAVTLTDCKVCTMYIWVWPFCLWATQNNTHSSVGEGKLQKGFEKAPDNYRNEILTNTINANMIFQNLCFLYKPNMYAAIYT